MLKRSVLESALFDEDQSNNWHMVFSERAALLHVLTRAQPDISLEIGTYLGGSLRPTAAASRHVYSFDIDDRSFPGLSNVTFVRGDAAETAPPLIEKIQSNDDEEINFILIDGNHAEDAVRTDIANCLKYQPKTRPTFILMHDSSNPACRQGIINAPWDDNPHVHALDLDFVTGMLYSREDIKGEIWGGLALGILLPEKRQGDVFRKSNFEYSRLALMEKSVYAPA